MNARRKPNPLAQFYREIAELFVKRFNEADLDRTDVQVQSVVGALLELLRWRHETLSKLTDRSIDGVRSKAPEQLETIGKEIDSCCENTIVRFDKIIWEMGLDLDDEQVSAVVQIAREALRYGQDKEFDDLN